MNLCKPPNLPSPPEQPPPNRRDERDILIDDSASAAVRQAIGSQLHALYHDILRQPAPEPMLTLLAKLERR